MSDLDYKNLLNKILSTSDKKVVDDRFKMPKAEIFYEGNTTYLFTIIGSPYTEDVELIYQKLIRYIHPSIIQGKIVNEDINKAEFILSDFIDTELTRGISLIEHSLGSARKMGGAYWKKKLKYYCIKQINVWPG